MVIFQFVNRLSKNEECPLIRLYGQSLSNLVGLTFLYSSSYSQFLVSKTVQVDIDSDYTVNQSNSTVPQAYLKMNSRGIIYCVVQHAHNSRAN